MTAIHKHLGLVELVSGLGEHTNGTTLVRKDDVEIEATTAYLTIADERTASKDTGTKASD